MQDLFRLVIRDQVAFREQDFASRGSEGRDDPSERERVHGPNE